MVKKWNEITLSEEAKKYENKNDFRNKSSWAVHVAQELGIYDKITSHMNRRGGWTKEEVELEASKHKRRVDFKRGNNKLWQFAKKQNYYEEICSHMRTVGNPKQKLVYEYWFPTGVYVGLTDDIEDRKIGHNIKGSVFEHQQSTGETPEIKIITDYIPSQDAGNLEKILIAKYTDEGFNVLNKTKGGELGLVEVYWTKEKVMELSSNYKYRWEFGQNHPVPYNKACKEKWDEVFSHMEDLLTDWDEEKIINTAKESGLATITEFAKKYSGAYHAAERLGIKQKLRDVFEWKGGKKWTKNEIWEIAKNYKYRSDFGNEHPKEYSYAREKGWGEEITSHMDWKSKGKKWTKEEVHLEAKKYKTRTEFARSSDTKGTNKAYQSASNNGWLDEVCSHMTVAKGGKIGKRK